MPNRNDFSTPEGAYRHPIVVAPTDIDELGHANNVVWVRWVNEVAIAHSRSLGLDHATYVALGVIWVVRRHDIEYLASALEGETLQASTWIHSLRGAASVRRTSVERGGRLLLRAETTWALVDTASGKPKRIPREMLERYGFASGGG